METKQTKILKVENLINEYKSLNEITEMTRVSKEMQSELNSCSFKPTDMNYVTSEFKIISGNIESYEIGFQNYKGEMNSVLQQHRSKAFDSIDNIIDLIKLSTLPD